MSDLWLWLETLIPKDDKDEVADFIMKARSYYVQYHTLRGFCYNPEPEARWWDGLTPRFKCRAGPQGTKVWRIGLNDPIHVGIPDTMEPITTREPGREMDVFVVVPIVSQPTWFVVFQTVDYKWICLAWDTVKPS